MPLDTCPDRDRLHEFSLGNVIEGQWHHIARHLETCTGCASTIALFDGSEDSFIARLKQPGGDATYLAEPEFRQAVAMVEAIGQSPRVASAEAEAAGDDVKDAPAGEVDLGSLGHYKLLSKLGSGGMGTVYKALHTRLEKAVAVKVLPADRLQDAGAVARFHREMRAVGKLQHPNIVQAHDAGEHDGVHYLVMEYAEGVDLSTLSRRHGPLPVPDACELIRQAAEGLQYAADHGLVHRDIKPSNLLLKVEGQALNASASRRRKPAGADPEADASGSPGPGPSTLDPRPCLKILDLGLALLQEEKAGAADELTTTGQIMGTLDYMAPEQASNTHAVDIRADIYSLGCTLYRLLAGRAPFADRKYTSAVQKMMAHAQQPVPPIDEFRDDVPAGLVSILDRMLAKDPEDRFSTPAEVARTLQPFAGGHDLASLVASDEPSVWPQEERSVSRGSTAEPVSSALTDTFITPQKEQFTEQPARPALQEQSDGGLWPARRADAARRSVRWWVLGASGIAAVLYLVLYFSGVIFRVQTEHGTLVIEVDEPKNVVVEIDGEKAKVTPSQDGKAVELSVDPGTHTLVVKTPDGTQLHTNSKRISISAGGKKVVKARLEAVAGAPTRTAQSESEPERPARAPAWQPTPEQQAFLDKVTILPPEKQVEAVRKKLQEVNAGFDGKVEHEIENGHVVELSFKTDKVTAIWPVCALADLKTLDCRGTSSARGRLSDLSPLKGMPLESLSCYETRVSDLSPLKGMPLTYLWCSSTQVSDLSPLKEMKLKSLACNHTRVSDLSPLAGMPLKTLNCSNTPVSDLSPLKGMPLTKLHCYATRVSDLSPLKGMPLTDLNIGETLVSDFTPLKDLPLKSLRGDVPLFDADAERILRTMPLEVIHWRTGAGSWEYPDVDDFWKRFDARRRSAESFAAEAASLAADGQSNAVAAKLEEFNGDVKVGPLGRLTQNGAVVEATLVLDNTSTRDITPLMGFTNLKKLTLTGGFYWLDVSCLRFLPLEELNCSEDIAFKNAPVLREMETLQTINGEPAAEFWNGLDPQREKAAERDASGRASEDAKDLPAVAPVPSS